MISVNKFDKPYKTKPKNKECKKEFMMIIKKFDIVITMIQISNLHYYTVLKVYQLVNYANPMKMMIHLARASVPSRFEEVRESILNFSPSPKKLCIF